MKLSSAKIDAKAEQGIWFPWLEDVQLLIAPASSKGYLTETRKEFRRHRRTLGNGKNLTPEGEKLRDEIVMRAAARHLLLDWKNVHEDDGETPIPYTPEVGFETFSDEAFRVLFEFVVTTARDDEKFLQREVAADLGNSSTGSDGDSDTEAT